jgi:hypothetical protein
LKARLLIYDLLSGLRKSTPYFRFFLETKVNSFDS